MTFVDKDEMETHIKVPIGMSMLEAAHEHDIELEGSTLACQLMFCTSFLSLFLFPLKYDSNFHQILFGALDRL